MAIQKFIFFHLTISFSTWMFAGALPLLEGIQARSLTEETCKCWELYKPQTNDGKIECFNPVFSFTQKCNIPQPPHCECTGDFNAIGGDENSFWCALFKDGEEISQWPCQNEKEWDEYNTKLAALP